MKFSESSNRLHWQLNQSIDIECQTNVKSVISMALSGPCIWRIHCGVCRGQCVYFFFGVGGVASFGSACILFIFVWHCYPTKCQKQTKLNSKNTSNYNNNNNVEKCLRRYGADKRTQPEIQILSHTDTFVFHMLSLSVRCGSCLDFYGLRLNPVVGSKHPSFAIESGRGVCFDCNSGSWGYLRNS